MGTVNDDGWISADDYDGDIPFLSDEENRMRALARQEKAKEQASDDELPFPGSGNANHKESSNSPTFLGTCPVCGRHVVERDKSYSCSNRGCHFALWKNNKFFAAIGKQMTREVAEELLNCGTVKLDECISRRTGNVFDCYVDLGTDEEGRAQFAIRFPES